MGFRTKAIPNLGRIVLPCRTSSHPRPASTQESTADLDPLEVLHVTTFETASAREHMVCVLRISGRLTNSDPPHSVVFDIPQRQQPDHDHCVGDRRERLS